MIVRILVTNFWKSLISGRQLVRIILGQITSIKDKMEKFISKCFCRALSNYVHKCDCHLIVSYYDFFFTEVTFTSELWHWCNMRLQNPSVPFPVWQYYIYIGSCAGHNRSSESLRRKFWRGNQLVTASLFLVYIGGPHITDYKYAGLILALNWNDHGISQCVTFGGGKGTNVPPIFSIPMNIFWAIELKRRK